MNKGIFKFTVDKAFEEVIKNCQNVFRKDQPGTWITDEVLNAFINLHKAGFAHSAEAWKDGELVGGIYGVLLGKVFFGESMFSKQNNASKFAFIKYIQHLKKHDVKLIDCQVYTEYLESLGAKMIERKYFLQMLTQLIN
jgi:leucyl/phenylalanyl-tRNA--protein transferase